jgi:hypothetical protein
VQHMNATCYTGTIGSSIVLLARIVDGAGRPILPSQVATIEYSVLARGSCRSEYFATGSERLAADLTVSDVLSPMLVNDDSWSVDVAGYNFRHDIDLGAHEFTPEVSGHVEVRYVFTQTDNTRSIVRFHLKLV